MREQSNMQHVSLSAAAPSRRVIRRRSFLHGVGIAGATLAGARLGAQGNKSIPKGDADILRFLAAAELIEADLWQQYNELGGVNGGNPAYIAALQNLDGDMPQYIADNTDDEITHAAFINAYLASKGQQTVDLTAFKMPFSTSATGAQQVRRLTTLQRLNVDTSWWTRYRSVQNIDVDTNVSFPQAININNQPAIPINDADTPPNQSQPNPPTQKSQIRMQAIANAAAFHFAFIEQGGSSLYPTMALNVTNQEVLRIVLSIGGTEISHFAIWHDKAGNILPLIDPETGVVFPNLNGPPFNNMGQPHTPPGDNDNLFQTNLIMPEPTQFLNAAFPACSIIRPTSLERSGAMAAVRALTLDQLFTGQSEAFFDTIMQLATKADAARRQMANNDD